MPYLRRIYLVRGLIALAWSAAFVSVHDALTATSVLLLIAYPLIDVVASLLDARENPGTPARKLQLFSIGLSALAAVGLGLAASNGTGAVLFVFGLWAIVSGAAQVTTAVRRRGPELGRQWPMLLAGTFSVIAGLTYLPAATGDDPQLTALITYTAAGGAFFVIQSTTLAWKHRRQARVA